MNLFFSAILSFEISMPELAVVSGVAKLPSNTAVLSELQKVKIVCSLC